MVKAFFFRGILLRGNEIRAPRLLTNAKRFFSDEMRVARRRTRPPFDVFNETSFINRPVDYRRACATRASHKLFETVNVFAAEKYKTNHFAANSGCSVFRPKT